MPWCLAATQSRNSRSNRRISATGTSSRFPVVPAQIESTWRSTGKGANCGCLSSSTNRSPRASRALEAASRSEPNAENASSSRYCARSTRSRPAINVGISVSRVGGAAQVRALRSVSGRLRVDLAQYRELEAFSAFGSDLDAASKALLARGERLVELLKQPQFAPFPVERQVLSIWAGTTGNLDDVPVADIRRFEREFLDYVAAKHQGIYNTILQTGKLDDDTAASMQQAIDAFKREFSPGAPPPPPHEREAEPMDTEGQEKIRRHRPPADGARSGAHLPGAGSAS